MRAWDSKGEYRIDFTSHAFHLLVRPPLAHPNFLQNILEVTHAGLLRSSHSSIMQANPENLQLLSNTLTSTVSPDASTRRTAEESLRQGESQPGFLLLVLELVRNEGVDMIVRQAGGVYFKNAVRRLWPGEEVSSCSSRQLPCVPVLIMIQGGSDQCRGQDGDQRATGAGDDRVGDAGDGEIAGANRRGSRDGRRERFPGGMGRAGRCERSRR